MLAGQAGGPFALTPGKWRVVGVAVCSPDVDISFYSMGMDKRPIALGGGFVDYRAGDGALWPRDREEGRRVLLALCCPPATPRCALALPPRVLCQTVVAKHNGNACLLPPRVLHCLSPLQGACEASRKAHAAVLSSLRQETSLDRLGKLSMKFPTWPALAASGTRWRDQPRPRATRSTPMVEGRGSGLSG